MACAKPNMPIGLVVSCFEEASYIRSTPATVYPLLTCQDLRRTSPQGTDHNQALAVRRDSSRNHEARTRPHQQVSEAKPFVAHRWSPDAPLSITSTGNFDPDIDDVLEARLLHPDLLHSSPCSPGNQTGTDVLF